MRGFEVQGRFKKLQYSRPGQLAVPGMQLTVVCLSLEHNGLDVSTGSQAMYSLVALPEVAVSPRRQDGPYLQFLKQ